MTDQPRPAALEGAEAPRSTRDASTAPGSQGSATQAVAASLRSEVERLKARHERELRAVRAEEVSRRAQIAALYESSTSWRLTAPLRKAVSLLRGRHHAAPARQDAPATAAPPAPVAAGDLKAATRRLMRHRLAAFMAGSGVLSLPESDAPDVSVILILHNQAELTFACLQSITECIGPELAAEVVILDNASTDDTPEMLRRVDGARIIWSDDNLHFLRGVNRAVREARGRHLLLLNNDALLLPGTVEAALAALHAAPDIGAVGGRLILPDGTLQEAGSIIWRDGTASGYGRGEQPAAPPFDFRRDVDYCSGAFLLTPRHLFEELRGFDERFAPAYYEETDYCVRLWEAGLRVVFDPDVVALHYEFGSSARSDAAIELQQRNHAVFVDRHRDWLATRPMPTQVLAGRSRPRGPRILVLEDRVPHEQLGSGYPRARLLVNRLASAGAEVTFFPMFAHAETRAGVRRTLAPEIEAMISDDARSLPAFLAARRDHYDAMLVCRPHNMRTFRTVTSEDASLIGRAALIYDAEAIFSLRDASRAGMAGERPPDQEVHGLVEEEVALARGVDLVLAVSAREKSVFERHGVMPVEILGHAVLPEPGAAGFAERSGFVFVGALQGEDAPNTDSIHWFVREVLPILRSRLTPDLRLRVFGTCEAPSIWQLDGVSLDVMGPVDDLGPALGQARVFVSPTRFAAGIPHKVHQAAALGVPIVATDLIAGLARWQDGVELLSASTAEGFAAACLRLHEDEATWTALRDAALARCIADCSPAAVDGAVQRIIALASTRRPGSVAP